MSNLKTDILIIGAGPSGTVAASMLKKQGYAVTIIEKQTFPRFVIGESLLPRCMENLEKAGFLPALEKAGFQKKHGAKFIQENESRIFDFAVQYTKGWTWTWQVKRDVFDNILAEEVQKAGVQIVFEAGVTNVAFEENQKVVTEITHKNGLTEIVESQFIIDASGYGRVLPKLLKIEKASDFPSRCALFAHVENIKFHDDNESDNIFILSHGTEIWGWLIPFSNGTASVGIVGNEKDVLVAGDNLSESYAYWLANFTPLKTRLKDARLLFEPRKISGYGGTVSKKFGNGFAIAGNRAELVDPIFSSGATYATESGVRVAELIHKELQGEEVNWQVDYADYLDRGNAVFKTFVSNWYNGNLQKIIYTDQNNEEIKKQICSILAGYVWDKTNPIVKKHEHSIPALAFILSGGEKSVEGSKL